VYVYRADGACQCDDATGSASRYFELLAERATGDFAPMTEVVE